MHGVELFAGINSVAASLNLFPNLSLAHDRPLTEQPIAAMLAEAFVIKTVFGNRSVNRFIFLRNGGHQA